MISQVYQWMEDTEIHYLAEFGKLFFLWVINDCQTYHLMEDTGLYHTAELGRPIFPWKINYELYQWMKVTEQPTTFGYCKQEEETFWTEELANR